VRVLFQSVFFLFGPNVHWNARYADVFGPLKSRPAEKRIWCISLRLTNPPTLKPVWSRCEAVGDNKSYE
jgi:hypothetical protein